MSGEAQSFSPTALQPDRLFPIGLVDVKMILHLDNLNVMMARFDLIKEVLRLPLMTDGSNKSDDESHVVLIALRCGLGETTIRATV